MITDAISYVGINYFERYIGRIPKYPFIKKFMVVLDGEVGNVDCVIERSSDPTSVTIEVQECDSQLMDIPTAAILGNVELQIYEEFI